MKTWLHDTGVSINFTPYIILRIYNESHIIVMLNSHQVPVQWYEFDTYELYNIIITKVGNDVELNHIKLTMISLLHRLIIP